MERVKRRKPTQEEMEKAINPELTDATASLCGQRFKVVVLPLNKEQVFLKLLRRILPQAATGQALVEALLNADTGVLCELAAIVAINSGQDMTPDYILENARMVDIIGVIEVQLEENGYLDFLLRMATVLPGILNARQ